MRLYQRLSRALERLNTRVRHLLVKQSMRVFGHLWAQSLRLCSRKNGRGGFVRNVTVIMSGTAVAQGITLIAAPILGRLFPPSMFGALGVFAALTTILSVGANLRYELAIVLPESDQDGANLLALSGIIAIILGGSTLAVVPIAGKWISIQTSTPELTHLLWWLPLSVSALGLYQALNYWSTRRKQFTRLSISRVVQSGTVAATQTSVGFLTGSSVGLIGGQTIGQAIATITLGWQVWRDDGKMIRSALSWDRIRVLARKYRDFPLYSTPQALLNALSQSAPALILAYFYSPGIVGLYMLAKRVLQVPIWLVAQSIRQVFYPKAAEFYAKGMDTHRLLIQFTLVLGAICLIPMLPIVIFGPAIFAFGLGQEWTDAGRFARWLTIWLYFAAINPPSMVLAQVHRKQRVLLWYEVALVTVRIAVLFAGGRALTAAQTVAVFSIVGALFNIGIICWAVMMTRAARPTINQPVMAH